MSHHLFIASFAALLAAGPAACAWAAQPQAATPASPAAPSPAGQPAASAAASPTAFPASWYGTWRGPMTVAAAAGRPISAEMELRIAPTDSPGQTTWTLSYLDKALPGGRQDRPYVLKSLDPAQGRYEIDERNGIILPATFLAGGLYAPFRLQDTLLQASYRLDGDRLIVEILSFNLAKPTTSGGQDGVPEVKGYAAGTLQRAVLSKVAEAGAAAPAAPASAAPPARTTPASSPAPAPAAPAPAAPAPAAPAPAAPAPAAPAPAAPAPVAPPASPR